MYICRIYNCHNFLSGRNFFFFTSVYLGKSFSSGSTASPRKGKIKGLSKEKQDEVQDRRASVPEKHSKWS